MGAAAGRVDALTFMGGLVAGILVFAELYPRLSLSGLLGFNAARLGDLTESESARYAIGAGIRWTPFDFGAIRSRIRASEARAQQSLASFEQTVAVALEETEGAFSSYTRTAQRAGRLEVAARHADAAAVLARARFEAGVTDFLAVLDAEREVLGNRDQLVQAQVGTATALVNVYRAIGGGWTPPPPATDAIAASPKSTTFTRPSGVSSTFSGLRSRWTMPRACAADSAPAIVAAISTASSADRGSRSRRARRFSPSTSSVTAYGRPASVSKA